jgi:hypothetical protein
MGMASSPDVDVAYQYLTFFLEDDEELERIRTAYSAGKMMTFEVKERLVQVLQELVRGHQVSARLRRPGFARPPCPHQFAALLTWVGVRRRRALP